MDHRPAQLEWGLDPSLDRREKWVFERSPLSYRMPGATSLLGGSRLTQGCGESGSNSWLEPQWDSCWQRPPILVINPSCPSFFILHSFLFPCTSLTESQFLGSSLRPIHKTRQHTVGLLCFQIPWPRVTLQPLDFLFVRWGYHTLIPRAVITSTWENLEKLRASPSVWCALKKTLYFQGFPGGPGAKTLCVHYRGHGFYLWLGEVPHATWHSQKNR